MTRFQTLLAAAATLVALPAFAPASFVPASFVPAAFAQEGVSIENPYARTMGGIGKSGAVFLEITNLADVDERLVDAKSDVAEKVQLHTHKDNGNGVMQMLHVPEGFAIPALGSHALKRGGDHVMLMGLTRELKDGDIVKVTLVFEQAGEVVIEAPVDNARKAMGGMDRPAQQMAKGGQMDPSAPKGHGAGGMADTAGMADADAITATLKAQFDTPENPLTVAPVIIEGDNALAGWAQGDKGGRALLARRDGKWEIILCGGPDLRMPEFLSQNGVSAAETLSQMYNAAEDGLGEDKVKLFSSFEGVVMMSSMQ